MLVVGGGGAVAVACGEWSSSLTANSQRTLALGSGMELVSMEMEGWHIAHVVGRRDGTRVRGPVGGGSVSNVQVDSFLDPERPLQARPL